MARTTTATLARTRALLVIALAGALLQACSGSGPSASTAPAASATAAASSDASVAPSEAAAPITITWWHWKFDQPAFKAWSDWVKTEYTKAHPNVDLVYFKPADIPTAVKLGISGGGDLADVIGVGGSAWEFDLAAQGGILDLKPFIDADPDWSSWVSKSWSAVPALQYKYKDQIIGAPLTGGPMFIYYWKDLFEKAGVQPPKTLDELLALPDKFKAAGVDTMVAGLDSTSTWQYDPFFWTLAGNIDYDWAVKKQSDECGSPWSGDATALKALQQLKEIYDKGVLRKQTTQETYDPDAKQAFNNRKSAMFYTAGVWLNGGIGDAIDQVGAIPFPNGGGADYAFPNSYDVGVSALNANDKQHDPTRQKEVASFVKFLTSPESQKKIWEVGLMPLLPEAAANPSTPSQVLTADQIALSNTANAKPVYWTSPVAEVATALGDSSLGMLLGAKTPEQVLADIDAACASRPTP